MGSVFAPFNVFFVIFVVFIHIQNGLSQSHWKSQKRSADANASEAPKAKTQPPSILTHQLQRRLLPKTEMQQKAQTVSSTANVKKPNKINDVDEIGGNEINRVSDVNGGIDDLQVNDEFVKQGECTNCGDDNSSKCSMPLPLLKSGDKRYYIGTFFKANWYRAAQFCRYHGMQLASVANQEENDKLEKYVTEFGYGFEHFWTSGTDLAEEGSFFWMSTGKPFSFTNWNAGEPNNFKYENGEEEHCLELWNRDGKGLKWNDSPCSFETYFICEL